MADCGVCAVGDFCAARALRLKFTLSEPAESRLQPGLAAPQELLDVDLAHQRESCRLLFDGKLKGHSRPGSYVG